MAPARRISLNSVTPPRRLFRARSTQKISVQNSPPILTYEQHKNVDNLQARAPTTRGSQLGCTLLARRLI